jgi:geranylgeranyl diphosphate synthase, type II
MSDTSVARKFDMDAIAAPVAQVETYMNAFLDRRPLPGNLRDAIKYALFGPGKRMRPILVVRSCEAVGGKIEQALAPAAAIELIHCFSLVHDDLPAMDNDDLRRGRPTLHKHTNDAMAILAGDGMMGLAFELIAREVKPAALAVQIVDELATGTNDMIAGQVYDTLPDFPAGTAAMEKLKTIHKNKTGALIRTSCRMGALAAGASAEQLKAMTDYSETVGLMFQVVDDILDVTQSTQQLGKTANKDVQQGKTTYPSLIGLDASKAEVVRLQVLAHESLDLLEKAKKDAHGIQELRDLCDYMAVRSK